MFGNTETYDGLSVVIDTFDNNAKVRVCCTQTVSCFMFSVFFIIKGDSPKIAVFINNGTLYYDHSR